MASSSAIRAGRAIVEISAENKIAAGLNAASSALQSFGQGVTAVGGALTGIGGAAVAGLGVVTKMFSDQGDAIAKGAKRVGITTEAYSELGYAAGLSGTSIEDVEAGMRAMSRVVENAATGNQAAADSLAKLGLSAATLLRLSPDEQIALLSDRISTITNPTLQAAVAMEVFGKSGTSLIPLLNEGSDGIAAMRDEAQKLGLSMSSNTAKSAERLNDSLGKMWASIKQVGIEIGAALAPMVTDLAETLAVAVSGVTRFIRENQSMIVSAAKIAAGVLAAGVALTGLGAAIYVAGAAIGVIMPAIAGLGAAIVTTKALAISLYAVIGAPWILLAGAVGVAAAAVGGAVLYFSGAYDSIVDVTGDRLEEIAGMWDTTVGGITDALMAGNIELAAQNLWAGLVAIWQSGTIELDKAMTWVLARYAEMTNGIMSDLRSRISTLTRLGEMVAVEGFDRLGGDTLLGFELGSDAKTVIKDAIASAWQSEQVDIAKDAEGLSLAIKTMENFGYRAAELEAATAKNKLNELRQQAAAERERKKLQSTRPEFAWENTEFVPQKLAEVVTAVTQSIRDTVSTFGQFGGANLDQINLVDTLEENTRRTAKAAEQTVKKLDQVREAVLDNGLRFT